MAECDMIVSMSNSLPSQLPDRLRTERTRLGLTQAQMASQLGIPVVTFRSYESGRSEPPIGLLRRLSEMGIDPCLIALGERLSDAAERQLDWMLVIELAAVINDWATKRPIPIAPDLQSMYLRLAYQHAVVTDKSEAKAKLSELLKAA